MHHQHGCIQHFSKGVSRFGSEFDTGVWEPLTDFEQEMPQNLLAHALWIIQTIIIQTINIKLSLI